MGLHLKLEGSSLISHSTHGLFGYSIRLLLPFRRLFRGDLSPVASCQGCPHCHQRWLSATLEGQGILPSSRVAPSFQLLVHIFDDTLLSETLMVNIPHGLISISLIYHHSQRAVRPMLFCFLLQHFTLVLHLRKLIQYFLESIPGEDVRLPHFRNLLLSSFVDIPSTPLFFASLSSDEVEIIHADMWHMLQTRFWCPRHTRLGSAGIAFANTFIHHIYLLLPSVRCASTSSLHTDITPINMWNMRGHVGINFNLGRHLRGSQHPRSDGLTAARVLYHLDFLVRIAMMAQAVLAL